MLVTWASAGAEITVHNANSISLVIVRLIPQDDSQTQQYTRS